MDQALLPVPQQGGLESYVASCVQHLQAGEGYLTCSPDRRHAYLLSALVHNAGVSRAADYLGTALSIVNRALRRLAAATGTLLPTIFRLAKCIRHLCGVPA